MRDLGRVAIGLGLMLLSLHILLDTLAPAEYAPHVQALLAAITGMPVLNVIFGAALAWAAHSSVAVVLLVMSLAYSHFITPVAALALVLGANLGSAINPLIEGGSLRNPVARRLPLGNLINRAGRLRAGAAVPHPIAGLMSAFDASPVRLVADFHTALQPGAGGAFHRSAAGLRQLLQWLLPTARRSRRPVGADLSRRSAIGRRRWR